MDSIIQGNGQMSEAPMIYGQALVAGYPIWVYAGQSLGTVLKD